MGCERTKQIGAYHDDELPAAEAESLARHVEQCSECRTELERLRAISRWLGAAAEAEAPPDVLSRIRQRIRPRRDRIVFRIAASMTAAAAAVLIVCSALLWQRWQAAETTTPFDATWATLAVTPSSTEGLVLYFGLPTNGENEADVEIFEDLLDDGEDGNQP